MKKYIDILKENLPSLKSKYPIGSMAVFGSVLRDDFDASQSDIDIMVDYTGDSAELFLKLIEELEQLTKRKVDLVIKRSLKPRHLNYLKNQFVYV